VAGTGEPSAPPALENNMANFSIWHWTILFLLPIVYLVPAARILRKAGFSGWLCLLLLVPPIT